MANITTQTIRVDLSTGKVIPTAYTHQNDTARTLVFDMYNGGLPYTMTGNTVKFAYKSPIVNGQYTVIAGSSMASGTVSGNTVSVTLPAAYTAISGVGLLTMIITPTSGTIRPVNIKFIVQKSADGDDVIAGASDFPAALDEIAENWLDENISIQIDDTLSVSGKAADAKVTGDEISELDGQIGDLKSDLANVIKCEFTTTSGKINTTGSIGHAGSNEEVYTSKIKCIPGQKFRFNANYSGNYTMWAFYATYDVDGNFIERIEISTTSETKTVDSVITVGSNVHGLVFTYRTRNLSSCYIYDFVSTQKIVDNFVQFAPISISDDLNNLNKIIISDVEINPDDFVLGNVTMSSSGWNYNESNTKRVVTKKNTTIHLEKGIKIGLTDYSDYRFYVGWRVNGIYYQYGWNTSDYITQMEGDYIILIARVAEHETDLSSKSELLNLLFFENTNALIYKVDALDKGGASGILSFNRDFKEKIIQGLRRSNPTGGAFSSLPKVLSLLHFSDIHGDAGNLARINEFRNEYKVYIDDTICTGDMVYNYYSDGIAFWTNSDDILTCIGNHDVRTTADWEPGTNKTMAESYQTFFAPFISEWGVTYQSNKTYYYKDYADSQIRLIVLDVMLTGNNLTDQLSWLETALAGAKASGYMVIAAEHYPVTNPTRINCSFTSTNILNSSGISTNYLDKVEAFINDGGIFGCWICGHVHFDTVQYNSNYPKQMFVAVTNALLSNNYSDSDRVLGDKSQDAFNILCADKSAKLIKIIRVGCDRDHLMRHMGTLVVDVASTPTVIYND